MATFNISGITYTLTPSVSPVTLTCNVNSTGFAQVGVPYSIEGFATGKAQLGSGQSVTLQLNNNRTWVVTAGSFITPPVTQFISSVSNSATVDLTVLAGNLSAQFHSMLISQFTNDAGYIDYEDLSADPPLVYDNTTGEFSIPKADAVTDGYLSATDWNAFNNKGSGSVTNVSALTIGTTGTDLSSSVANSTTTPVITLNVPTASATNRGALSSSDWTLFNAKQATISVSSPITLTGASVGMVNQGTTTTVLHGNAAGNPSFSAIVLTTDVTGVLPAANGGAGAWVDYSGTSTVVGWGSFTTKIIRYQESYKKITVTFVLIGTSNSTSTSFTLPFSVGASAARVLYLNLGVNNGVGANKLCFLDVGSSTVVASNSATGTGVAWAATGAKQIEGQFVFEID